MLIIQTTGDRLVAVQRTDLDANDPKARELAIADNRASELGLEWNPEMLADSDLDLKPFFTGDEFTKLIAPTFTDDSEAADDGGSSNEIDVDAFELAHKCPRCSFEFNDK